MGWERQAYCNFKKKFSKNFVILITKTEIRGYYIYEEKIIRAETFSPMESFFEIMYNRIMYMGFKGDLQ